MQEITIAIKDLILLFCLPTIIEPDFKGNLNLSFKKEKIWHENCLLMKRKIILRRALNFKICIFIFSAL